MVQVSILQVQGNLRTRASKSGTPVKIIILPLLASLSSKRLQIGMGMLPIITSTSDELSSHINIDDFQRPWATKIRSFYWFLQSLAAAHISRMNWDVMAGDRLFASRNCYRLSHVSWALAQISCCYYYGFGFVIKNNCSFLFRMVLTSVSLQKHSGVDLLCLVGTALFSILGKISQLVNITIKFVYTGSLL